MFESWSKSRIVSSGEGPWKAIPREPTFARALDGIQDAPCSVAEIKRTTRRTPGCQ